MGYEARGTGCEEKHSVFTLFLVGYKGYIRVILKTIAL